MAGPGRRGQELRPHAGAPARSLCPFGPAWFSAVVGAGPLDSRARSRLCEPVGRARRQCRRSAFLDRQPVHLAGVALVLLGIAGSVASQVAMGASWRADVDPDVGTELVTTGPFRLVRNPVLTATATTIVGLALMVPNVLGVIMVVLCPGFDADPGPLGRGAVPGARPRRSLPTLRAEDRPLPARHRPPWRLRAPSRGIERERRPEHSRRSPPGVSRLDERGVPTAARCRQSASGGSGGS